MKQMDLVLGNSVFLAKIREALCCHLIFAEGPNGRDSVGSHQAVFTLNTVHKVIR